MAHKPVPGAAALPPDEARRRRREAVLIGLTAAVFVAFAIFEAWLPQLRDSGAPSGNITFFLLINLNLILLVLLVFLVTRNLVKLLFERRRRILGAQLRTRLVLAFTVLTLLPAVSLFIVAQGFLDAIIENWFSNRVQTSLAGARDLAEAYYLQAGNTTAHFAHELARQIGADGLLAAAEEERLRAFVEAKRVELNLAGIEVFVGQESVAAARLAELHDHLAPPAPADLRTVLIEGADVLRVEAVRKRGDVVRSGVPIGSPDGPILGAVVVESLVPRALSRAAQRTVFSFHEYRQLRFLQQPIENGYVLTFLLITLIVIFSATWFGFHLAKGLTGPIQRLGEGMREVAQGNWEFHADPEGDEEMATLVSDFNYMTAQLRAVHSALEERRQYIENVLANIAAGVVSLNAQGAVVTVNPAAATLLGLDAAAVHGQPWRAVFQGDAFAPIGAIIAEVTDGRGATVERQIKLGGAPELTVWVTGTALTDEAGATRGVILFFEDVTQLLRVERMEAWREVARRIAHEIKNPLTPIQLSAQRLRKRYGPVLGATDGALFEECTRTIVGQVEELKRLVNEFSTFARLPAIEVAPHDLNAVAEEALVLFREAHRDIAFVFEPDPALPLLELDREAIKRAIINMLDNAVAACQPPPADGARIALRTACDAAVGVARLEVADNGAGMPPDVRARAFEPYFSTKKEGSGLGLAIVSAIVADHHAYIRLRDNVPHGTRVVVEFPLRRPAAVREAASA